MEGKGQQSEAVAAGIRTKMEGRWRVEREGTGMSGPIDKIKRPCSGFTRLQEDRRRRRGRLGDAGKGPACESVGNALQHLAAAVAEELACAEQGVNA